MKSIRTNFINAFAAVALLAIAPLATGVETGTIGLSYAEVAAHLEARFHLSPTTPAASDGLPRYMGKIDSKDGIGILSIVGDKANVARAEILVGLPSDAPDVLAKSAALAIRFMGNITPGWRISLGWMGNALTTSRKTGEPARVVRGSNVIIVSVFNSLGMVSIQIKPVEDL